MWDWCRTHRHDSLGNQWWKLKQKLEGHYAYYGVRHNLEALRAVYRHTLKAWKYWLSRRTHTGYVNFERFERLVAAFPLPQARIKVAICA